MDFENSILVAYDSTKEMANRHKGTTLIKYRKVDSGSLPGLSPLSYPNIMPTTKNARAEINPLERVINPLTAV